MKIVKKPNILPCECKRCGGIVIPRIKDLVPNFSIYGKPAGSKEAIKCPFCDAYNNVEFERRADNDRTRDD